MPKKYDLLIVAVVLASKRHHSSVFPCCKLSFHTEPQAHGSGPGQGRGGGRGPGCRRAGRGTWLQACQGHAQETSQQTSQEISPVPGQGNGLAPRAVD